SSNASASAAPPAKPASTLPSWIRSTFRLVCLIAVLPKLTWPSPATATFSPRLTARTVVDRISGVFTAFPSGAAHGSAALRPRVCVVVHFPQLFPGHVGVNLRGGETGVPEQLLNRAQVRAILQEVRGEAVPQRVRRRVGRQRRFFDVTMDDRPHRAVREAGAVLVQ